MTEPDRPLMTIWYNACALCAGYWITKATDTHSE